MDRDMNILYILGVPLGYVMEWIYNLIPNYGWDIIIFTIVIRLLSIPLQLNQQKSMAKMSAFQPMIADIQKKYKDKPEKQQEELMKLHQKEKVTVIFITHNIQEAVCLGTRILVMAKQGGIKMDVPNTIPKPVTPASEGYGQMWDMFNKALHQEG